MNMYVDIGNTRLKWGVIDENGTCLHSGALTRSELDRGGLLEQLSGQPFATQIDAVWVCSVAQEQYLELLNQVSQQCFSLMPKRVRVGSQFGSIQNAYQEQTKLGVDRWVAAIGARRFVANGNVIIIEIGTAITVDWLGADNVFTGGVILPGFELMHNSLVEKAHGIDSHLSAAPGVIGRTTMDCVNAGVQYGLAGAVKRVVDEMNKLASEPAKVVLSGGGADQLITLLEFDVMLQPNLVLYGLHEMAQNQERR